MHNKSKNPSDSWAYRLFRLPSQASNIATAPKEHLSKSYTVKTLAANESAFAVLFAGDGNLKSMGTSDNTPNSVSGKGNPNCSKAPPTVSTLNQELTVAHVYPETRDTKTFRLSLPDQASFAYLPGQYVTVTVTIEGKEYKRSYSIASSPTRRGVIELTVKRDAKGGIVSNWLNDELKAGDRLQIKGPFGNFSCARHMPDKVLFLAAGSGIVPIMSMLRWLTDIEQQCDIVLVLSFRSQEDIIYRDELRLIKKRHPNIRMFVALTQGAQNSSTSPTVSGRLTQAKLARAMPDVAERQVYLCGPFAYMESCKAYLNKLQLPKSQLFCESFEVNDSSKASAQDSALIPLPGSRTVSGQVIYTIRFVRSGKSIETDGSLSLLMLAEQNGVRIDHECKSGSCGACMIKCLEGEIIMTDEAEIDDKDKNLGWIYSCCAYPTSNVVLDL